MRSTSVIDDGGNESLIRLRGARSAHARRHGPGELHHGHPDLAIRNITLGDFAGVACQGLAIGAAKLRRPSADVHVVLALHPGIVRDANRARSFGAHARNAKRSLGREWPGCNRFHSPIFRYGERQAGQREGLIVG